MYFVVITVLSLWLYWLWSRRHYYQFALRVPGDLGLPLIGSFLKIGGPEHQIQSFEKLFRTCKSHSICVWLGLYPALLTTEPEILEKIFLSPELKNKAEVIYKPLYDFFGGGILSSPAKKWQHDRRLINPAFSHKVLLGFFPSFDKAKNLTISKFDNMVGKGEQKLETLLKRTFLDLNIETTMGRSMHEGNQYDNDLAEKYTYAISSATQQVMLSFANLGFIMNFSRRFIKTREYLRKFVEELVLQKISNNAILENGQCRTTDAEFPHNTESSVLSIKKTSNTRIFIDQALQLYQEKQFNWQDISSESNTIVTAAFETIAITTYSTIIMLAMHNDIQEKLFNEILSVFPEKDLQMTYEHIAQLPYLDMVINEVLRLMPPVPFIGRQVVSDIQLTPELLLPKGLQIMIPIFNLHHRQDIWGPDADKFNPDNFLPENKSERHPYAYIPFSKGARNCIGWRYAQFAVKTMVVGLVRQFLFKTSYKYEDLKFSIKISLEYVEEPGLEIHKRND